MKTLYFTSAAMAILFALSLLALQIVGGLEYTHGASLYSQASMVAAMVTVALLPLMIDVGWRASKGIALVLVVGFMLFLAYSMPAAIGRIGEVREAKALAAGDAASLEADLKAVNLTLATAQPQMEAECLGAPDPLPLDRNRWPECRRKRGTVTALLNERSRISNEVRGMGTARVGDTSSQTVAWMFSSLAVTEQTIRRGSGIAFAIGLELIIAALIALVPALIRRALAVGRPAVAQTREIPVSSALTFEKPLTPDEIEELRRVLLGAGQPLSNGELARRLGISDGESSKRVKDGVALGILQKQRVGREVAISVH